MANNHMKSKEDIKNNESEHNIIVDEQEENPTAEDQESNVIREDDKTSYITAESSSAQDTLINMRITDTEKKFTENKMRYNFKFPSNWWSQNQKKQKGQELQYGNGDNRRNWKREECPPVGQKLYPPKGQSPIRVMIQMKGIMRGEPTGETLSYEPDRNGFVAIVMIIVLVMILMTAAFVVIVYASDNLTDIFRDFSMCIMIFGTIMLLIVHYSFMCLPICRMLPSNIVMLLMAVFAFSLILTVMTCHYDTEIVIYAAVATAIIVMACFFLALTPIVDFTAYYMYVVVIAIAFTVVTMLIFVGMAITGHYLKPLHLTILIISVALQSVLLVMELQMVLGGRAIEIGEEDWALAAYMLYTSVLNMFTKLIQIIFLLTEDF